MSKKKPYNSNITPLSHQALRFCIEIASDPKFNATRAAIAAGYSTRGAGQRGSELLKDPRVKAEIERIRKKMPEQYGVNQENIVQELAAIAFSNIGDMLRSRPILDAVQKNQPQVLQRTEFELEDLTALTRQKLSAISEVIFTTDGNVRIKMYDKIAALDKLSRILGLYERSIAEDPNAGPEVSELERAQRIAGILARLPAGGLGSLAQGGYETDAVEASGESGGPVTIDATANGVREQGG